MSIMGGRIMPESKEVKWDGKDRRKEENAKLRDAVQARLIAHRRIKEMEEKEAAERRAREAQENDKRKKKDENESDLLYI
jgi:hypothetical protein